MPQRNPHINIKATGHSMWYDTLDFLNCRTCLCDRTSSRNVF